MTQKSTITKRLFVFILAIQSLHLVGQTKEQAAQITSSYDMKKLESLKQEFKAKEKKDSIAVAAYLKGKKILKRSTLPDGSIIELQRISPDGKPLYYTTNNEAAARATRTNHLHTGGSLGLNLMGTNMKVHVWDLGIARASHQEYDGLGGNNRYSVGDGTTTLSYHSAHVTGTIMASGVVPSAKGMAPHARVVGYNWNSDLSEATTAATQGMLISNHSYGYSRLAVPSLFYGAYQTDSRNWDNLMYNAPYYLMVSAAGNDGNFSDGMVPLDPNFPDYDKLSGFRTAKNNLVVANAQDPIFDANGNVQWIEIVPSSSKGPTDDLRIKPDITGNGTGVYSTMEGSDTAYEELSGTSMASPNVSGSLLLLQEHYHNQNGSYMKAATLKGLALHTADDVGPVGPDAIYGWGLLNTKKAAETISQRGVSSFISEQTINQGQTITFKVKALGTTPLKASISWTDIAGQLTSGNSNVAALVNDLDIRISKAGVTSLPWRLTGVNTNGFGDNTKDPYERIDINNASGDYVITITHKGNLTAGSQNFSLVVTGINATCTAIVPSNLSVASVTDTTATLSWNLVANATYQVRYKVIDASTWNTVNSTTNSITLTGLVNLFSTTYQVQVKSICSFNPVNSSSDFSSSTTFTTLGYCSSQGIKYNEEYIGRVQLNTINNVSANEKGGYSNFTNVSTNLSKGNNYTITVTPTWKANVYPEGYSAWIDYNKNFVFEDSEMVWSQSPTTATPVSGSITVPATALNGATRMRISMKFGAISPPCVDIPYGEVEDYTINIEYPATPTNLSVVSVGATSANLSWNAVSNASYQVQYRVVGSSTWTTVNSATTTIALPNLTPLANYEAEVRTIYPNGSVSVYSQPTTFTTLPLYCTSQGNSIKDEYIGRVQFNTINNPSGAENGGYSNFTNLSTYATKGATYTLTVTPTWTAYHYPEGYSAWIDYNKNGVFEANEMVWSQPETNASSVSGTFTIPTNTTDGTTRMRVSLKYNAIPTACETFAYGEVEDYNVIIRTATVPENLSVVSVTNSTANLTWNAVDNNATYQVQYRELGSSVWAKLDSATNAITLIGLWHSTNYEVQVRTVFANGSASAYCPSVTFTTLGYCESMGNSTANEYIGRVQFNTIDNISWNENGGYSNFTNLTTIVAKESTYTLTITPVWPNYWPRYVSYAAWIDYNQSGTFEPSEMVWSQSATNASSVSGNITISNNRYLIRTTRMRVSMKYNGIPLPCETFSNGEVEDYNLYVINPIVTTSEESSPTKSEKLYVYPNPTDSELFLSSTENVSKIAVYNTLGQEVMQSNVTDKLDVSHLSNGLYIVNVLFENGTMQTVKFNKK